MTVSLALALQHLRSGRFADLEQVCLQGLRENAEDIGLLTLLGVALHRLERSDVAIEVFRRAVALRADAAEALTNLGVLLHLTGREAEAEPCLRRLLVLQPASLQACQHLGQVRRTRGDMDEAHALFRRAALLNPSNGGDVLNLAGLRLNEGWLSGAIQGFKTLTALEPDNAVAYAHLAASWLTVGEVSQAATVYERAYRLDPANSEASNGVTRCRRYRVAMTASRHPGVPEGLVVHGPYQGITGYAHMTNRLVNALAGRGVPVHAAGLLGGEAWASPVEAAVRSRSTLSCVIPPLVERVPGLMTVNLSMFEGTRIPLSWRRFSDRHDLVIVPTESSRIAWAERGYPEERLRVCPLGVDPETMDGPVLTPTTRDGRSVMDYRHRILNVSDFVPRKNVDGVLRVWLKATTPADDAVLILKLGKGSPQTRAAIEALIRQTESAVGKRLAEAAPVVIVDRTMDEGAMTGLFRAATHYWSLSHGEGWDLPMSKAGALGLQLVAPAHSSYLDYLDETVARMIPATVGPAHLPNSSEPWPTFYGLDWWEPDEDVATEVIGRIVRGEDGAPRAARRRLLDHFTWAQAADRLLAALRDAGAA